MQELIVIGGGAAGFFCAVNAARMHPELRVTILEKSGKLLSKVRISGGGRCNVTHDCSSVSDLVSHYPRGRSFVKKSFPYFNHTDTVKWFEDRGVMLKKESDGRMFPVSDDAETIIQCLMREANQYRVQVMMNADVMELSKDAADARFVISLKNGRQFRADYVCIACGGFPKESMFDWLRSTGHEIVSPVPSLFTFNITNTSLHELMGISLNNAVVRIPAFRLQQSGPLLITHWGLSGPAVLALSAWGARDLQHIQYSFQIVVNWIPEYHENSLREELQQLRLERAPQKTGNRNPFALPDRLWKYHLLQSDTDPDIRWADLKSVSLNKLAKNLTAQSFQVNGKTTFKEEFVTAGGIVLADIDPQTMESKKIPGLFFAGEIMDVDGITGGFNFQHAWSSGWLAAQLGKVNNS